MPEHNLFKPKDFEEGKHAVVGDCNGFTMQQRWDAETPLFAREILSLLPNGANILDYGCGVGRLAKEVLKQSSYSVSVTGVDASPDMMQQARDYVNDAHFSTSAPVELGERKFDLCYLVYVLQHVPAIEIREILARIHYHLKEDGCLVYCSSDYRMAIRYDGGGFFDDRFLGVDLRGELSRYFDFVRPLFSEGVLESNEILNTMVRGGLQHPAFVLKRRHIDGPLFNAQPKSEGNDALFQSEVAGKEEAHVESKEEKEKIVLVNRLAPGDILVMTNALRDLHLAHPGKYETAVRTPCNDIFVNNPYVSSFGYDENEFNRINAEFSKLTKQGSPQEHSARHGDVTFIDMQYPMIHTSGKCGWHFSYGHTDWLSTVLGVKIPVTDIRPQIFLSDAEKKWVSPAVKAGCASNYWVINAGSKSDFTLKQYPYYQQVVDVLKDRIQFVQIGLKSHTHESLDGVLDMVGKTDSIRELFRLIYHAQGVITCVSFPMHIAAAFNKPCVVVSGAREGTRWELYSNHQFLYVNGCLPCALNDGCWKSRLSDCNYKREGVPICMTLIKPADVARAVERYYDGGMLHYDPLLAGVATC
jgi:ADP-heptose:LPS heptosyltransferase/SAM-dependent methyltransferase